MCTCWSPAAGKDGQERAGTYLRKRDSGLKAKEASLATPCYPQVAGALAWLFLTVDLQNRRSLCNVGSNTVQLASPQGLASKTFLPTHLLLCCGLQSISGAESARPPHSASECTGPGSGSQNRSASASW
jgi:hypothetical protein